MNPSMDMAHLEPLSHLNRAQKRKFILREQLKYVDAPNLDFLIDGISNPEPPAYKRTIDGVQPPFTKVTIKDIASRFDLGNVELKDKSVRRVWLIYEGGTAEMQEMEPIPQDELNLHSVPIHRAVAKKMLPLFAQKYHAILLRVRGINEIRRFKFEQAHNRPPPTPFKEGKPLEKLLDSEKDTGTSSSAGSRKRSGELIIRHPLNKKKRIGLDHVSSGVKTETVNRLPDQLKVELFNAVANSAFPNYDNVIMAAWNIVSVYVNIGSEDEELHNCIGDLHEVLMDLEKGVGKSAKVERITNNDNIYVQASTPKHFLGTPKPISRKACMTSSNSFGTLDGGSDKMQNSMRSRLVEMPVNSDEAMEGSRRFPRTPKPFSQKARMASSVAPSSSFGRLDGGSEKMHNDARNRLVELPASSRERRDEDLDVLPPLPASANGSRHSSIHPESAKIPKANSRMPRPSIETQGTPAPMRKSDAGDQSSMLPPSRPVPIAPSLPSPPVFPRPSVPPVLNGRYLPQSHAELFSNKPTKTQRLRSESENEDMGAAIPSNIIDEGYNATRTPSTTAPTVSPLSKPFSEINDTVTPVRKSIEHPPGRSVPARIAAAAAEQRNRLASQDKDKTKAKSQTTPQRYGMFTDSAPRRSSIDALFVTDNEDEAVQVSAMREVLEQSEATERSHSERVGASSLRRESVIPKEKDGVTQKANEKEEDKETPGGTEIALRKPVFLGNSVLGAPKRAKGSTGDAPVAMMLLNSHLGMVKKDKKEGFEAEKGKGKE